MFARIARLLLLFFAATALNVAFALAEPTLDQVYKAAQAGQLIEAQAMMAQVLANHPASGKAHYVEAELLARQGLGARAREALATAESLAPGLPFARPAAVQALRAAISPQAEATPRSDILSQPVAPPPAAASSFPWGLALGLAALAGAAYVFLLSRRRAVAPWAPPAYAGAPGLPAQPAGMNPGSMPYGAAAPAPGMGSRIAGGLATGLAVGAGVVAAEEIGRRMMGPDHRAAAPAASQDAFAPLDRNADMGGNDFGVNDAGSWDDGAGGGSDGGGGWDS